MKITFYVISAHNKQLPKSIASFYISDWKLRQYFQQLHRGTVATTDCYRHPASSSRQSWLYSSAAVDCRLLDCASLVPQRITEGSPHQSVPRSKVLNVRLLPSICRQCQFNYAPCPVQPNAPSHWGCYTMNPSRHLTSTVKCSRVLSKPQRYNTLDCLEG